MEQAMRRLLVATALVAVTSLTPAIAQAHDFNRDFNRDLYCRVADNRGNDFGYSFGPNSINANRQGGTLVETSFMKNK
jgi:hypothetical protein